MGEAANILIVDDQPDNLRVLAAILGEQGYRVRKALNGETALETIEQQLPDLLLLDVNMPQMDGYEVCSRLKASPGTCDIPVIFLSALDSTTDKVKAFAVGGADYITKPFQAEEVLVRVRQQLVIQHQKRQLQQEIQERKQAQTETQLLLNTIRSVSETPSFEEAIYLVLCEVRRSIAWDYAEAWVLNEDRLGFHLSQTCYDPHDLPLQSFAIKSQTFTFAYNNGLLGRVWASQQPEWIVDASQSTSPEFLRSQAAETAGLKAVFCVPVALDRQVLAILMFSKHCSSELDTNLLKLANAVALQLGGLIQRRQAEEALKQANRELQRLVNLDGLTQIANRRCFDQVLQQEWKRLRREQAPISLILTDIDFFKQYNDHYGHLAGDECLRQVAQAINQSVKRPADQVARYGGEEFGIILPHTTVEGAICVAEQIQAAIAQLKIPHVQSTVSDSVTLSIGIACTIPDSEDSVEQLIAMSDRALYVAKANGRNICCTYVAEND